MNRPPTKVMLFGHPIVAVPMTLAGGIGLAAGLYGGNLFPALICGAVGLAALKANEQANRYKAWKANWDALGDGTAQRGLTLGRFLAVTGIAVLIFALFAVPQWLAYGAGYAVGWIAHQPRVLAGVTGGALLIATVVIARFIRHFPRRAKLVPVVTVVARPVLPVPSLAEAYRALPDYCHALMAGRS